MAAARCRYRGNICKILSGDNHLQFCDKHYKFHTDFLRNNPSILKKNQLDLLGSDTPDLTKNKKVVKKQSSILPPDEERCCRNDGMIWRCKNYRMKSGGGAENDTKNYCEEHCRSIFQHSKNLCMKKKKKKKKKKSEAGLSKRVTETRDSNRFKRPGKRQLTAQPSTSNPTTSSDRIVGAGSVKISAKRKKVERMSGELKSLTGIRGPVVETRASNRRKMVMEGDETSNQLATNDNFESDGIVEGGPPKIGTQRKNVERTKGSGEPVIELESVELYKSNCFELSMELEKNKVEVGKMKVELEKNKVELEKKKVECTEFQVKLAEVEETRKMTAKDENSTEFWRKRCSDLESLVQRMENENATMTCVESRVCNLGSLVPWNGKESSILRCQELSYSEKIESKARGLQNEITQTGEKQRDENNMSEPTTSSDRITEGASPNVWTKMKNVESTKGSGEPVNDQLESVELYKSNCFELSMEPEKNKVELEKVKAELEKNEVELEKKKVELEKNKVDLEKMKAELEKKKMECTEFQDKLAEVEETRKSTSKDENATEFWRMKCSDAEILVQRMENENSTIGCVETRVSNLVSLVPGNGKESSILRCQELSYSEAQNEISQTGEKQSDKDKSKPNAETRGEGSKDSCAYELKIEEKVLNVEEGKGWGCLEERPSQHGSSSQADLEMCKKTSVNLVSDSNDGGDSLGAEDSLGDSMDMLAMKNLNMNKDKMLWNSEADMLSSVEDCMKAVGALYQQEISED